MDNKEVIIKNLEEFGLSTDIKAVTMKHLAKVTDVLDRMTAAQTEAIQGIKANKISLNKVAKESGIARQTFYNNPILAEYIEKYIELKTTSSPYETIEALREEVRRKDEQISKMVQRDATLSQYKARNDQLSEEILSLQATIRSQEDLIRELRKKSILEFPRR